MDFITGLLPSKRNTRVFDAILVVVDRFSKLSTFIPTVTTVNALMLADLIFEHIICVWGAPNGIVSDRGSVFTSEYWSELCYHSKITRKLSMAFHPQTDGQTERVNQTLEHYLRTYADDQQTNWAKLLPMAQFACNNAVNVITGKSPFFVTYGYNPEIHFIEDNERKGGVPAAEERVKQLWEMRKVLAERWQTASEASVAQFNKKHQTKTYTVGQWVMLLIKNLNQKRPSKKLSYKFIRPFIVLKLISL